MFRMCIACSIIEKMTKDQKIAHSNLLGHSTVHVFIVISVLGGDDEDDGGRRRGGGFGRNSGEDGDESGQQEGRQRERGGGRVCVCVLILLMYFPTQERRGENCISLQHHPRKKIRYLLQWLLVSILTNMTTSRPR